VCEQIADGYCKVMIWVHESCRGCDDAVPVRIWVVGKRDAKLIFQANEAGIAYGLEHSIRILPS
jgi:hypothetical protein